MSTLHQVPHWCTSCIDGDDQLSGKDVRSSFFGVFSIDVSVEELDLPLESLQERKQ